MGIMFIGDNNPDGMTLGFDTNEKVSFHGKTPIVQATVAATTTTVATTTALETDIDAIRTALINIGIIK